jgi:hypothetical protein
VQIFNRAMSFFAPVGRAAWCTGTPIVFPSPDAFFAALGAGCPDDAAALAAAARECGTENEPGTLTTLLTATGTAASWCATTPTTTATTHHVTLLSKYVGYCRVGVLIWSLTSSGRCP